MNNFRYTGIIAILLLFSLSVAAQSGKRNSKSSRVSDKERAKAERIFIEANKAKFLGDYQEALTLFAESARKDPQNHVAYYELAKHHYEVGQYETALSFSKKASDLDPSNKWYHQLYAEILASINKFKDAAKIYQHLAETHPNNYEYYLDWAFMLVKGRQYDDAIKIYNELEKNIGVNENITFQKQRIYLKLGKVDKAAQELEKLIKTFPAETRYYLVLADLLDVNNLPDRAFKVYERLVKVEPDNPHAYLALAEHYKKTGDRKMYMKNMEIAFRSPILDIDSKIKILFPYINSITKDSMKRDEAFRLSEILLEANPDEAKSFAMYGDFLYYDDKLARASEIYRQALKLDNSRFTIWRQLMTIQMEVEEYDSLLITADNAIEVFPNQTLIYFYQGVAHMQNKDYQKAVDAMERGVMIGSDNKILVGRIYSSLGDAFHSLNDHASSDSCYEESLQLDPGNEFVLNNYSYYLSERNMNLEKAFEMSQKSNEIQPDNASFQDTFGWILYKMKNFTEAERWIKKAMETSETDKPVLFDHHGDVLFQLGEKEKALEQWKKALKLGLESKTIQKKIADRKLYE